MKRVMLLSLIKNKQFIYIFIFLVLGSILFASSSSYLFHRAKIDEKVLLHTPSIRKYRHNWLKVIKKFLYIAEKYPHSNEASCSYLEAGKLYEKLFRFSSKKEDLSTARNLFRKSYKIYGGNCSAEALFRAIKIDLVKGFRRNARNLLYALKKKYPQSKWRYLAEKEFKRKNKQPLKESSSSLFQLAEVKYSTLIRTRQKQFRHNWFKVMRYYKKVIRHFPSSFYALKSYVKIGFMYEQLYRYGLDEEDLSNAVKYYQLACKDFPGTLYCAKALWREAGVCIRLQNYSCAYNRLKKIIHNYRNTVYYRPALKKIGGLKVVEKNATKVNNLSKAGRIIIKGVRYWSSNNYTRIVIYSDKPFDYNEHFLPADKIHHKPPRFYFDINNAILLPDVPAQIAINDGLLLSARVGQFTKTTVRTVLDLQSVGRYTTFTLDDPFRLVIDVFRKEKRGKVVAKKKIPPPKMMGVKHRRPAGKKVAYIHRRLKIVIDPGHGGKDTGAVCCGIREKDITLAIALKLAALLRKRLGAEIVLTRYSDIFIPLEERTALANTENADAFISIHVNSTPKRNLTVLSAPSGAIVFYLGKARDFSARRVAQIENQSVRTSVRKDWIGSLINELEKFYKRNDSIKLAMSIQKYLNKQAPSADPFYRMHHIEGAPFYVLVNTSMPAVLVETGFINNPFENKLLTSNSYQNVIAEAIFKGLKEYFKNYVATPL